MPRDAVKVTIKVKAKRPKVDVGLGKSCPYCLARAGVECKTSTGGTARKSHKARIAAMFPKSDNPRIRNYKENRKVQHS